MERNKIKILAIDDKKDNLISLKAIASDIFPDSIIFLSLSGPEGIKIASAEDPDVILLDIVMPGMDGFEVCRLLKKNEKTRDIPVVFLTALKGDRENHIKALEAGAEAFLSKPIDETELTAQIRAMVKIKEANLRKRNEKEYLEKLITKRTTELENSRIATLNLLDDLKEEIKARKLTEEKLLKSEEHFRALIENSSEGISIIDIMGNTTYSSPSMKNVLGYSEKEVNAVNCFNFVHPDHIDIASEMFRRFISGKTKSETVQVLMKHKSGEYIWIEATGTNMLENDSIKGIVVNFRNINERKKAEHKLSVMAKMLDIAPNAITIHDLNGKFIYTNSKNLELHGYTFDEMMSLNLHQLDVPESEALINQRIEKIKNTGEASFEVFHFRKDGTSFPLMVFAKIIEWQDRPALISIASDLTEKKKEETKLKESEEKFRQLAESSTAGIFIHSGDRFEYVNKTTSLHTGFSLEELYSMKFIDIIYPEDRKMVMDIWQKRSKGEKIPDFYESRLNTKDGGFIWAVISGTLIKYKGQDALIGTAFNITAKKEAEIELKESEERYKALHNASFGGIAIHDKGLILECNQGLSDITGYSYQELIGMNGLLLIAEHAREKVIKNINDGYELPYESTGVRKNGEEYPLRLEARNVPFKGKQVRTVEFRDITDQKKAEKELEKNRKFLSDIIENSGSLIFVKDVDGKYILTNSRWETATGLKRENTLGKTDLELFPYPMGKQFRENDVSVIESGKTLDIEEFLEKNGEKIFFHSIKFPLKDESGRITGICGMATDITGRKLAEEKLRKSEYTLQKIFDTLPIGLWFADNTGKLVSGNPAGIKIWGAEPKVGLNEYGIFKARKLPERTEITPDEWALAKTIKEGVTISNELLEIDAFDGKKKIILNYTAPIIDKDTVLGAIVINEDITEMKKAEDAIRESEDRFRTVLEYSHSAICIISTEGKIVWANEALIKIGGYSREAICSAPSFAQFIAPDSLEFVTGNFMKFVNGNDYEHHYDFYFIRSDGSKRLMEKHMTDYTDKNGQRFLAVSMSDITEKKEAEEEKEKLQAQLYQVQKMESIGRLAGGVAHDFNNMLSVIIGRTELAMIKAAPPSPLFSELSEIKIAAEKSAALTGQLLAFARKQVTTPKIISLNDEIEKMFKMLKRLIGENIELVWKKEKNLLNTMIDPSQIDQILTNLCINAKDAISENGKITIETENIRIGEERIKNIPEIISGDYVLLKVSDNGCGMNDETLKHIFEPFFTTKEVGKGTGLGLPTVFGIVKQNRGYISVESVPGYGAEFSIYFPSQNDTVSDMRNEGSQNDTRKGNGTILLVEDESSILEMTETMLKSFGYEVISANSPQEAINKALEHTVKIDLLITDIIMPEINGRELAKKIMTYHPGIKCLFMSGYTADVIANEGVISEKMNFIQKPFTMNRLSLKIIEIFEQK